MHILYLLLLLGTLAHANPYGGGPPGFSVAQRQFTATDLATGGGCMSLYLAQTRCAADPDCTAVVSVDTHACAANTWKQNQLCVQDCTTSAQQRDAQGRCYCNSDSECSYPTVTGLKCTHGVCGGLWETTGPVCWQMTTSANAQRSESWDATTGTPSLWIKSSAMETGAFDVRSLQDTQHLVFPTCSRHQFLMPHTATCVCGRWGSCGNHMTL